jgi:HSP20 family protein
MFKIIRRDPYLPILNLFDEFVNHSTTEEAKSANENISAMVLDLAETTTEYRIVANLPGVCKEDAKISLDKNQLTIEATHTKDEIGGKEIYHHRERFFGKYYRTIYLQKNVESSEIKAKMENGLLELIIPKEAEKPQVFISID